MKNKFRILSVVLLAVIYGFAISVAQSNLVSKVVETEDFSGLESQIHSAAVANLFSQSGPSKTLTLGFNKLPTSNEKEAFGKQLNFLKATELLFNQCLIKQLICAYVVLTDQPKILLLFPFHSFW